MIIITTIIVLFFVCIFSFFNLPCSSSCLVSCYNNINNKITIIIFSLFVLFVLAFVSTLVIVLSFFLFVLVFGCTMLVFS